MAARRSPAPTLPTAAIALTRISDDREDARVGVNRQEEDCRTLADRLGWVIGEVVVENDTSAYATRKVVDADGLPIRVTKRPELRRVLRELYAGAADGLIVYDIDRLARQPRDLEALIDVVEQRGVPVVAVTGAIDLSTSGGRAMARVLVAMANKASEDTGRRVARAHRQAAESGRPKSGGFRPFGYETSCTGVREDEAAVIREVAERVLLGDSIQSIARDLNARGVPTVTGAPWGTGAVRSIVTKPTVAGLRSYHGEVIADGDWEPILDRGTWELVRAVIARNARDTSTRAVDKYLLSGLARCGSCSGPLYVGKSNSKGVKRAYRCPGCWKTSRSMEWLDEHVTQIVEALLERETVRSSRARHARGSDRAQTQLTAMRERRREILREFATNLAATDLREMLDAVDGRIAELEQETAAGVAGVRLPRPAEFRGLPLQRRRAVIRALCRITLLPANRRPHDVDSVFVEPAY